MLTLTTAPHLQVRRPSPTTAEFTVTTCPPPTLSTRLLLGLVLLVRVLIALSALLLLHSTWTLSLSPLHHPTAASTGVVSVDSIAAYAQNGKDNNNNNNNNNNNGIIITAPAPADATTTVLATIATIIVDDATTDAQAQAIALPAAAAAATARAPPAPPAPTTLYTTDWAPYLAAQLHASPLGRAPAALAASLPPWLALALGLAVLLATARRVHTTESLLVLRGLGIQTSSAGGSYLASWRAGTRFIPTEKIRDVLISEAFRGFAVRHCLVVVVDGEDDVVVVFPRLLPRRAIVERVWRGCRGCLWEPQDGFGVIGLGGRRGDEKSGAAAAAAANG